MNKLSKISAGLLALTIIVAGASSISAKKVSATTCTSYTFGSTTLKKGSTGTNVANLQNALNALQNAGLTADGKFGNMSKTAVMTFQSAHGLTADGAVGAMSRAALATAQTAACGGTTSSPVTTGPVSVALAQDTPVSGAFMTSASGVQFAKFTFTGNGTVTSVKLMRTGISSSTTVNNVYLYDGVNRLTDGASIGSTNTVTFNSISGLFTVAGSKTITVVADTGSTADYSLGFNLTEYTAGGSVNTVSLAGNLMYGASSTLATVTAAAATGSGSTDAGADITVWQSTGTVATRDVVLHSLALRQIGSIVSTDINNFKLYVDGVLVATTAALDSNGYVTFAPNTTLHTGARTLKVTADIIGGSGRTVSMSLRGSYDLQATDSQYNANGTSLGTYPNTATAFTVNAGTMTVVKKTTSQSTNVTIGASDQSLATYTFTAYGEPIKVETLHVGMITTGGTVTDNTLRNVRILVNGAQVGSNTSVPAAASFAAASGTSFTTNFLVYPGSPATVEIRSDIFDNEGTDDIGAGTTTAVQALLVGGTSSSNGVPQTSITAINVPTASNVLGNNLTIASGTMSLAKTSSYASRSIAVPNTAYKVGSFQLSGNSTEAINLNTIYVGFADTTNDAAPATDLSDLYVMYGPTGAPTTMTSVKGTVTCTYSSGCTNPNSWSINQVLAVNQTMQFDVYASVASSLSTNSFISTLAIAGTTANSGIATYADASGTTSLTAGFSGQEITGATGSVTMSLDASNSTVAPAKIVDDGSTITSLVSKIVALTDSYTVTDMTVTVSNVSAVSTATLKYAEAYTDATGTVHTAGEVIGASKPAATSMTWSGLSMAVSAGTTAKVAVELVLAPVGVSAGTSGSAVTTAITAFTARNGAGTSATGTGSASGSATYVYKAIPTLSTASMSVGAGTLSAGTSTLSKFSVNTNGTGTIAWNRIIFRIAKTSAPTLASFTLWNTDTGVQVAGTSTIIDSASAATCLATLLACNVQFVPTSEQQITGSVTYALKATVAGTLVSTDSVTTTIDNQGATLGFVAPTTAALVGPASGVGSIDTYAHAILAPTFIWSDVSASGHATSTSDWSNDYLVRSLPLDSQSLHV